MDSTITEEELFKARSKVLAGIIIREYEEIQREIEAGVYERKFSVISLIKPSEPTLEKPTGAERNG